MTTPNKPASQQPAATNPFTREYAAAVYAARKASTPSTVRA